MQNVSKAYKESMRATAKTINRNHGYIRATIGIINLEAQEYVSADKMHNDFAYFSDLDKPFEGYSVSNVYATAEQDFSKVDGSMYFLPTNAAGGFYNNGLVTKELLGGIYINFKGKTGFDIKGLTIDFSDYYPVDFSIENDQGTRFYTGNNRRYWTTEDVFNGTSYLRIVPSKMVNGQGRLRIFQFSCGIVNVFTNKETKNYTSKEFVSSVTETIPSTDMSLTVDNQNQYFSPDNPDSALAYMEIGQKITVAFGYDTLNNGEIEWLPPKTAYLKTWTANDKEAKFTATDQFDYLTGKYYRGLYREQGISLYNLAEDVLGDAGITDKREYFLDPYLENIIVYNPMPVVKHSEALQIIANAGRCALYEDRNNRIHLQASFVPDMKASTNTETNYSCIENVLVDDKKDAYAICSNDFSVLDGSLSFMPSNHNYLNIGYVSNSIWVETKKGTVTRKLAFRLGTDIKSMDESGHWTGEIPKIVINLEAAFVAHGLFIRFRNVAPKEFHVITYYQGIEVNDMTVERPDLDYIIHEQFNLFDRMEIIFTKGYPNARITVDNVLIGDVTDYVIGTNDVYSTPTSVRQKKIKSINIKRNIYTQSAEAIKNLIQEEILLNPKNTERIVYFSNPSYGLNVNIEENETIICNIVEFSNYFARLSFGGITGETVVKYTVTGHEYVVDEGWFVNQHNENGEVIEWKNPLISTTEQAKDLEEWLSTYYLGDIEYQISWRGDPRTDANDLYYLELKNGSMPLIRGYENSLNFNGSWSGTIKARKAVL